MPQSWTRRSRNPNSLLGLIKILSALRLTWVSGSQQPTWANWGLPFLFWLRALWTGRVFLSTPISPKQRKSCVNRGVSIKEHCTKSRKHGRRKWVNAQRSLKLCKWNTKSAPEQLQYYSCGLHWVCFPQAKGVSKQGWSNHFAALCQPNDSLPNLFNMKQQ